MKMFDTNTYIKVRNVHQYRMWKIQWNFDLWSRFHSHCIVLQINQLSDEFDQIWLSYGDSLIYLKLKFIIIWLPRAFLIHDWSKSCSIEKQKELRIFKFIQESPLQGPHPGLGLKLQVHIPSMHQNQAKSCKYKKNILSIFKKCFYC